MICVTSRLPSLNFFVLKQLPVLPPAFYSPAYTEFIAPRVLELAYTPQDLQAFAREFGHIGPPFAWNQERRVLLRAELDAYYARLCGLTRKQLRYILDPHDLTDRELEDILDPQEDPPDTPRTTSFPGETFRVLKERELRQYGEYRTRRLVLEAWDRLASRESAGSRAGPAIISTEPNRLPPGYRVNDKYTIVRRIAEGGSGAVYEAHDPLLNRRCALKVFHGSDESYSHQMLEQEGQALAALSHPHIVQVFDAGILPESTRPYLVTAFVDGSDLTRYTDPGSLLPSPRTPAG